MKKIIFKLKKVICKILNIEIDSRKIFLNSIPEGISILEIGPFFNPVCVGENVAYFDIIDQEALRARATEIGYKEAINRIPYIDYVSPIGDLNIIHKKFDAVISCHAIEHQLDLIAHLQSVSKMLTDGGLYYMIIPDKRYCFDHYMAESTIAEVLSNYYDKKQTHSLKSVIEHRALTTHNSAMMHWNNSHGNPENVENRIQNAIKEYEHAEGKHIDVHAWYFTPYSISKIISMLNKMNYIDLAVNKIIPTTYGNLEFYVVLEPNRVENTKIKIEQGAN